MKILYCYLPVLFIFSCCDKTIDCNCNLPIFECHDGICQCPEGTFSLEQLNCIPKNDSTYFSITPCHCKDTTYIKIYDGFFQGKQYTIVETDLRYAGSSYTEIKKINGIEQFEGPSGTASYDCDTAGRNIYVLDWYFWFLDKNRDSIRCRQAWFRTEPNGQDTRFDTCYTLYVRLK